MSISTKTPTEPTSPATKSLAAATRATAAAESALQPARDNLEAAEQAVTDANAEAFAALTTKHPDAAAARERVQNARAAVKEADDDAEWAQLQLQAAEAVHEQAHAAEQAAGRAVTVEEYLAELDRSNSPDKREDVLLAQLKSLVIEVTVALSRRDALHNLLAAQWASIPDEEKPPLRSAGFPRSSIGLRGEFVDSLHWEVGEVLKEATAAAAGQLQQRWP